MLKTLPTHTTAFNVLKKLFNKSDLQFFEKKAQVILMVGMPGSGKSTISELLVSAYGFWRFSTDQIRIEELFPDHHHRMADKHDQVMPARQFVYQELTRRVVEAVKRGQKVVVDGTNMDSKRNILLDELFTFVPREAIALVIVKTPEDIMTERFA